MKVMGSSRLGKKIVIFNKNINSKTEKKLNKKNPIHTSFQSKN